MGSRQIVFSSLPQASPTTHFFPFSPLANPMPSSTPCSFFLLCNATVLLLCLGPSLQQQQATGISLDTVRDFLTRQEDTIVFSLIERARYPYNSPAYDTSYLGPAGYRPHKSLAELFIRDAEAIQSQAGRYQNPEEVPFFPCRLPFSLVPSYNYTKELYPAAASVNVSDSIWSMYFNQFLPLFTREGDDGNYAVSAALDLTCLQALSRRVHYGRFVAEAKFRGDPQNYTTLIRSKDRDALMKVLTSETQEKLVKRRAEKKAMVFGQNVTLDKPTETCDNNNCRANFKIDPLVVYKLYDEWVIPLTKEVEVEYILHRLD